MPIDAPGAPVSTAAPEPRAALAVPPTIELGRADGRFRRNVWLTWAVLAASLAGACYAMHLDFAYVGDKLPFLLGFRLAPDGFIQGAALTIFVTACSMFFALLVALLTALGRLSRNPVAFAVATFYASLFRGTPLMVQVLIIYLALPQVGIVLGALSSGLIALSLNYGAYLAETIRSGMMAVPAGQREAAMALGIAALGDRLEGDRAAGAAAHHSPGRRVVRFHAEGLLAGLADGSVGAEFPGAILCPCLLSLHGDVDCRGVDLLGAVYRVRAVQFRLERRFGRGVAVLGRH